MSGAKAKRLMKLAQESFDPDVNGRVGIVRQGNGRVTLMYRRGSIRRIYQDLKKKGVSRYAS